MIKFSSKQEANQALARLDGLAEMIQKNHTKLGMTQEQAKPLVNLIDKMADAIEASVHGGESMLLRQAEVIMKEPDEPYMSTFDNPQKPIQTDADEKYMGEYSVDQSSAVHHGVSTTGRPLAP